MDRHRNQKAGSDTHQAADETPHVAMPAVTAPAQRHGIGQQRPAHGARCEAEHIPAGDDSGQEEPGALKRHDPDGPSCLPSGAISSRRRPARRPWPAAPPGRSCPSRRSPRRRSRPPQAGPRPLPQGCLKTTTAVRASQMMRFRRRVSPVGPAATWAPGSRGGWSHPPWPASSLGLPYSPPT